MIALLCTLRENNPPQHVGSSARLGGNLLPKNKLKKGFCLRFLQLSIYVLLQIPIAIVTIATAAQSNTAKPSGTAKLTRPSGLPADQRRGKLLWKFNLGSKRRLYGPVLGKKNLFVGDERSALYAIDKTSGAKSWKREIYATGIAYQDGAVYMTDEKGFVRALDATSGATKWEFKTGGGGTGAPIVSDGIVYALSNYYNREKASWSGYLWLLDKQGEEVGRFVRTNASFPAKFVVGSKRVFVTQAQRGGYKM